jgi:hypothetical protein
MDKEKSAYEQIVSKKYELIASRLEPKYLIINRKYWDKLKEYVYYQKRKPFMFMGMQVIFDDSVETFSIGV